MNTKTIFPFFVSLTLACCYTSVSLADDDGEDLDVTITVVDEDDSAETAFTLITLPEQASATGVENSQKGIDTANLAREDGQAFGQATAEAAKNNGEEAKSNTLNVAADASNQNQESIKDLISSKVPDVAQDLIPGDVLDAVDQRRQPELPPQVPGQN